MRPELNRQQFLGPSSEGILNRLCVGIVGMGGGGSHITQQLAHIGIKRFILLDPDRIEESNLNRLVGGTIADTEHSEWKVQIGLRLIQGVSREAHVIAEPKRWQERGDLVRECDILFGCVDSFSAREELEKSARRYLVPYIDIGMDVHGADDAYFITGQVALSMPGEACLRCMSVLRDDLIAREAVHYGAAGGRPQVIWPNGVLASMAVGVMMQLVVPWNTNCRPACLLEYDGNVQEVRVSSSARYLRHRRCGHFGSIGDLGDPWYEMKLGGG